MWPPLKSNRRNRQQKHHLMSYLSVLCLIVMEPTVTLCMYSDFILFPLAFLSVECNQCLIPPHYCSGHLDLSGTWCCCIVPACIHESRPICRLHKHNRHSASLSVSWRTRELFRGISMSISLPVIWVHSLKSGCLDADSEALWAAVSSVLMSELHFPALKGWTCSYFPVIKPLSLTCDTSIFQHFHNLLNCLFSKELTNVHDSLLTHCPWVTSYKH